MIMKFRKAPGRFIVIDRDLIDQDTSISYKAKGILVYLMGRPETWKPNIKEIATHASDKIASVKSGVQELKRAGYVTISRIRDPETQQWVGWEWYVTDVKPKVENPLSAKTPKVENPLSGKSPQLGESQATPPKNAESRISDLREIDFDIEKESIKRDSRGAKEKKKEEEERVRSKKMKTLLQFTERGATPTTSRARLQAQAQQLREQQ